MGISDLLLPDTRRAVRDSQVHCLRPRMDWPIKTRNSKHPMVDSNPSELLGFVALGMKAENGGYKGLREGGSMVMMELDFNNILAFFANEAHSASCFIGCGSLYPTRYSRSSSTGFTSPPFLLISNRLSPYYELYFQSDNSTSRVDFDIMHCYIVAYCVISGWILMVSGRRVGYYNLRSLETLYLPDLGNDIDLANDINHGIFGCFTSTPDNAFNATLIVTYSVIALTAYRYSQSFGGWISDTIYIEPQIARAHTKITGAFCWVNELTGTLNVLRDWALRNELEVESVELGENFTDCYMISSVIGTLGNFLVTSSYDLSFKVCSVEIDPLVGVRIFPWSNLGGMSFYIVSNGTGFNMIPHSIEDSNMLYVASFWEDDLIQCKINDEEDQEVVRVKTCPHLVEETCKCRAAWFLI